MRTATCRISWNGLKQLGVLLTCSFLLTGAAPAGAQPQTVTAPPVRSRPNSDLIQLNEGIAQYLTGSYEGYENARKILEALRQRCRDEGRPVNAGCLYYLGLVYLSKGTLESQHEETRPDAAASFEEARKCLETLVEEVDPVLRPVEALLDLSVAQLASDQGVEPEEAKRRALKAVKTLEEYVASETGKTDRLACFYLGIAYWRLGYWRSGPGRAEINSQYLQKAASEFDCALDLAEKDRQHGTLSQAAFEDFQVRLKYYRGLLSTTEGNRAQALANLNDVIAREPSSVIGANARELVNFLEAQPEAEPQPMSIKSPAGPIRFEGFANTGHFYDSNLILLGHDTVLPRGISQKHDYRFGLEGGFDVSRSFTKADGILGQSLLIGVGGTTTHFWQPHVKEFDINVYEGRAYVNWEPIADLFAGVQYDYGYTLLGHHPFISSNRITPVISKIWRDSTERADQRAQSDIYYSYDYRDYRDELYDPRLDRDGKYHAVGVTQSFNFVQAEQLWPSYYHRGEEGAEPVDHADGDRWLVGRLGYDYRNERTQGDEFDLWGNTVWGGVEVPLPWRMAFEFRAEFTWDNYTQPNLFDYRRNERFDFIQHYDFGLTRMLVGRGENRLMPSLQIRARAGVELTFQDSNVWDRWGEDLYSYDRAIYSITLAVNF